MKTNAAQASPLRGFTLVELMVTITVLAILLAIAVPSFDGIRVSNRLTSYAGALASSSQLARTEAIKRDAPVTLCASTNGTSCGGVWEAGWIILSGTTVIQRQQPIDAGYRLADAGGATSIAFESTGVGATQATFTICRATPAPGGQERVVQISATGRFTLSRTQTGTCA
jgi:type IV fimbrial biogenesis protein FimT